MEQNSGQWSPGALLCRLCKGGVHRRRRWAVGGGGVLLRQLVMGSNELGQVGRHYRDLDARARSAARPCAGPW